MSGIAAAVIGGVAAVGAGAIGAIGASKAAKAQKQAATMQAEAARDTSEAQLALGREQLAQQKELYERGIGLQEPFRQAGLSAQNRLVTLLGLSGGDTKDPMFGAFSKPFTMEDFRADPGYAFRMSEGMQALERSAAARGGLLSGATMKGALRFGQGLASEEFGNAYNRFYNTRNQLMNPLQSFLGQGQTATNAMSNMTGAQAQALGQTMGGMANAYGQLGQNLGAAYGNMGQARASGYAGMANAAMGAFGNLGNVANQYAQNQMMMQMFNPVQTAQYGPGTSGFY